MTQSQFARRGATIALIGCAAMMAACGSDSDTPADTAATDPAGMPSPDPAPNPAPAPEPPVSPSAEAIYQVTFTAQWTGANGFGNVPGSAHFSPVIGAAVNGRSNLWSSAQQSSAGLEQVAETGATSLFEGEISDEVSAGFALGVSKTGGTGADNSVSMMVRFTQAYPQFTFATMVAPSSDWFVGLNHFDMMDVNGDWLQTVTIELPIYDAGTEQGTEFSGSNPATVPTVPVALLNEVIQGGQLTVVDGLVNGNAIASVTLTRIQ